MTGSTLQDRDRAIVAARRTGESLAVIAERHGVTRERIRQILARQGGPTGAEVRARRERAERRRLDRVGDRIHVFLARRVMATRAEVCAAVRCSPDDLRRAIQDADRDRLVSGSGGTPRFSDEAIMEGLRELSSIRAREQDRDGLVHVPLTAYDRWRDPARLPSSIRIQQRYGNWRKACVLAGLPVPAQTRSVGVPVRWTDGELVIWVARFLLDSVGRRRAADYDHWARRQPGAPGLQTVNHRLGGWVAARRAGSGSGSRTVR